MSEFFGESGALVFMVAASLWYVTLMETAVNIQFVFIFIWGIVIMKYIPWLYSETIDRLTIVKKAIAIVFIIGVIYLITT